MERVKEYIKNYILGLFEGDLRGDMKYLENELIGNDLIASDDNISYNWNNDKMEVNIENKGLVKKFEVNIEIKEVEPKKEKYKCYFEVNGNTDFIIVEDFTVNGAEHKAKKYLEENRGLKDIKVVAFKMK